MASRKVNMPAVRKNKIPLGGSFWLAFFSKNIQRTLEEIRKTTTERNAVLCYCECVCFHWGNPDEAWLAEMCYRPPKKWKEVFGDNEECEVLGTNRGDLKKPPHGTSAGFVFHYDDCPALVAELLHRIARFDFYNPKTQSDKLALWQSYDPGAEARLKIFLDKRRGQGIGGKPQPTSEKDLKEADRHHAEWHEIEAIMNTAPAFFEPETMLKLPSVLGVPINHPKPSPLPTKVKGKISQAAYDVIKGREKILNKWPSVADFVPKKFLSSSL
jgi:hypothetical protein